MGRKKKNKEKQCNKAMLILLLVTVIITIFIIYLDTRYFANTIYLNDNPYLFYSFFSSIFLLICLIWNNYIEIKLVKKLRVNTNFKFVILFFLIVNTFLVIYTIIIRMIPITHFSVEVFFSISSVFKILVYSLVLVWGYLYFYNRFLRYNSENIKLNSVHTISIDIIIKMVMSYIILSFALMFVIAMLVIDEMDINFIKVYIELLIIYFGGSSGILKGVPYGNVYHLIIKITYTINFCLIVLTIFKKVKLNDFSVNNNEVNNEKKTLLKIKFIIIIIIILTGLFDSIDPEWAKHI